MRFRWPTACAALLLLAVAGCGDHPAPAAGPTPSKAGVKGVSWRVEVEDASVRIDPQVVTVGPDDVWVFGGRGDVEKTQWPTARHWDGRSWRKVDLPGGRIGAVRAAGASSASDVWAVTGPGGADASVLHWDGARWGIARRLPGFGVTDMEVFSPQDVRVYGSGRVPDDGLSWSYTASGWSKTALPFAVSHTSARSARDIWALAFDNGLYHYDGHGWRDVSLDDVLPSTQRRPALENTHHLMEITATADAIWITVEGVGAIPPQQTSPGKGGFPEQPMSPGPELSSLLLHGNPQGTRWTAERLTGKTGRLGQFGAPITDTDGGVWLIGSTDPNASESALAHRTPTGTWTRTKIQTSRFDYFEVRAFARIPNTTRFLFAGMNDERGAILSSR